MARYFTLEDALKVLPFVEKSVREAIAYKTQYTKAEEELQQFAQKVVFSGGMNVDREKVTALKETRETSGRKLSEAFEAIQSFGCVVKDLDIGLLDFLTLYRGEEVCLCWRLGEETISHWHSMEDGFRGRKPINQEFLANHRGDSAS
jgi:hypothetical protein